MHCSWCLFFFFDFFDFSGCIQDASENTRLRENILYGKMFVIQELAADRISRYFGKQGGDLKKYDKDCYSRR